MGFILIAMGIVLYFLPWMIAANRGHHNAGAIAALNFFLGWSVIGWVIALVWALSNPAPTEPQPQARPYGHAEPARFFCKACGNEATGDAKYCVSCGRYLRE